MNKSDYENRNDHIFYSCKEDWAGGNPRVEKIWEELIKILRERNKISEGGGWITSHLKYYARC